MNLMTNLYWNSFTTTAFRSKKEAFNKAKEIMLKMKLQNVKINPSDVNGTISDTIFAVTFVQLDSTRFVAIAMSSGSSANTLISNFLAKLKDVVRID